MHHVLFTFKHYHEQMTKIDVWLQMNDEVRSLYLEILRFIIKNCNEVVQFSWRYHITYIKVLEVILDSNYADTEDFINTKTCDSITPREIQK